MRTTNKISYATATATATAINSTYNCSKLQLHYIRWVSLQIKSRKSLTDPEKVFLIFNTQLINTIKNKRCFN